MNHIKTILLFLSISCWSALYAQTPSFEWAKSMGGTTNDQGRSIAMDEQGNVYTAGDFRNTVDFDPGSGTFNLISNGAQDIFVQKLDTLGSLVWARSIGGTGGDQGNSMTIDTSGNVYVTGQFQGTVDFDPGAGTTTLTSSGSTDVFVLKLDSSGNLIWAKSFGGTGTEVGNYISTDILGNVYTTGYFEGSVDFNPGPSSTFLTSNGVYDIFVHKLNPNGNFLWAKGMGGSTYDYGRSIITNNSGDVYITGDFSGTADFYSGTGSVNLNSSGGQDIFVQKLSSSGSFIWVKNMGGVSSDYGQAITVDTIGNIYTTGYFSGTADFDPGAGTTNLTSNGSTDIFVHKLNASGDLVWAKNMGGTGSEGGNHIATDASAYVYITGWFEATADFDPGAGTTNLTSNGSHDIFVQKLNSSGNIVWAINMGGTDSDIGYGIITDNTGNVHTVGTFKATVDFDPDPGTTNLTSNGNLDIFVQKLSQCLSSASSDVVSACDSYTWIDGITYNASNSTATHTLTNVAGCDSVVILNLTINSVSDISTTLTGLTITANNTNATYQWLDCDNNYFTIQGETGQNYIATVNGNYAVQLTENSCVDTSTCITINTVGIFENSFKKELTLYPNPTSGLFYIDFNTPQETIKLKITDVSGKLILDKTYKQIKVIEYELIQPNGIYFIELSDLKDQRSVTRLIKQ